MKQNDWFKESQYGMMIHFGLYSLLGGEYKGKQMGDVISEWIQSYFQIPCKEYEKLLAAFNPIYFNADEWTDLAIKAGMKYVVITSKHHEGFALFKSYVDKYNVVDSTPFKRDIIKELSDSCHKKGLKFGLYYSQELDWHEPYSGGYSETFETNQGKPWKNTWDFPNEEPNFEKCFRRKIVPQVTELLTNYGDIDLIWFDTPTDISKEQSQELYDLVKKYQPNCLINSRIGNGLYDYIALNDNEVPDNLMDSEHVRGALGMHDNQLGLYESACTLNETWGFSYFDNKYKTSDEVYKIKNKLNKLGANYLINVGPDHLGRIPTECIEILKKTKELESTNVK